MEKVVLYKKEMHLKGSKIGVSRLFYRCQRGSIVTDSKHMIRFRILAWDLFLQRRRNMEDLKLPREVTLFSISYGSDSKSLRIPAERNRSSEVIG